MIRVFIREPEPDPRRRQECPDTWREIKPKEGEPMSDPINLNIRRAEKTGINDVAPTDILEEALRDIREGILTIKPTKALIILLDNSGTTYDTRFYQAGMKASELIALIEYQKQVFFDMMRGKPE